MLIQHAKRASGDGQLPVDIDESGHAHGDAVERETLVVGDVRECPIEGFRTVHRRRDSAGDAHMAVFEDHITGEERADFERQNMLLRRHFVI